MFCFYNFKWSHAAACFSHLTYFKPDGMREIVISLRVGTMSHTLKKVVFFLNSITHSTWKRVVAFNKDVTNVV